VPSLMRRRRVLDSGGRNVVDLVKSHGLGLSLATVSGQKDDPHPPDVFLPAVAIADDRLHAGPISRPDFDDYSLAHPEPSYSRCPWTTPIWTLLSGAIRQTIDKERLNEWTFGLSLCNCLLLL